MSKYTITIDYTPAYEQGAGIGRLVRNMVKALVNQPNPHQYKLFVSGYSPTKLLPTLNADWRTTSISPSWFARMWYRLQLPIPIEIWSGYTTLYHATDFVLPPTLPKTKKILTVHDLSFVRVPQAASPALKKYLDAVVPRSIQAATHIIADSQATKEDIMTVYNTPEEKITVVLSGVEDDFSVRHSNPETVLAKYALTAPYFFCIGTIQPRKNYSRIIRALAEVRKRGYDIHLVIVGGKGWLQDEMYQTIQNTRLESVVHLLGFVGEEDVKALYQQSLGVIFASLYEGFGFPILEGMASGVPVITSNCSSMPEVAGNSALIIDPNSIEQLRDSMQTLIENTALRQMLITQGQEHIKRFTWQNTAKNLAVLYERILSD